MNYTRDFLDKGSHVLLRSRYVGEDGKDRSLQIRFTREELGKDRDKVIEEGYQLLEGKLDLARNL